MTEKKDRDRVVAEITLSHVLRLATEQDSPESREQALAFFNQAGHAYEMWKHMMQAAEDFIGCSLLRRYISPESLLSHAVANPSMVSRSHGSLAQMWARCQAATCISLLFRDFCGETLWRSKCNDGADTSLNWGVFA